MRWLRAWSHILLPLFLSLALIQLFISDHKSTKTLQHWNRQLEAKHVEMDCAQKQTCPSCTRDKRCIWCREEGVCKKYCFPYSDCKFNSIFWANCRVDLFGITMLILVALLAVGFLWYCLAYHLYMEDLNRRQAFYYARNGPVPGYGDWNATGKTINSVEEKQSIDLAMAEAGLEGGGSREVKSPGLEEQENRRTAMWGAAP
ncbi:PTTG1IP family member 2 [Arvicola amphibius]|uniref:PTTG1IP family member 2 n=1 Tax=Arvicola amphibius TaxID=1047088 RepID=UPI001C09B766|nr:PTTG1IP family member 2 [Arvicola amphibius]